MSSVSEQDHLNPRDPLYYAPRSLRERSASRGASPETQISPVSFDSQLESAVSDALRHPLDPELMHEPDPESKKALWTIAARFAAAVGVAALVALFFVVAVPGSRQGDSEPSMLANFAQSIRNALSASGEVSSKACDQRIPGPSRRHAAERSGGVRAGQPVAQAVHAVARKAGSGHATTHQPIIQKYRRRADMPENRLSAILFSRSLP